MIDVSTDKQKVVIRLKDVGNSFDKIITVLKTHKFTYKPSDSSWSSNVFVFDKAREDLEHLDFIVVDCQRDLEVLREGQPEQVISSARVLPDYSLVSYPPIKGKEPFEDFQHNDIVKGLTRNRYAYFLDMGLGKGYILSVLIAHYYMKWGKVGKVLLLTTSIGVRNLRGELLRFIRDLSPAKVTIADKDNRAPFTEDVDIVIASYNSFRLVCNHYKKLKKITSSNPRKPFLPLEEWGAGAPLMLALDESHNVAIPSSQQSNLVRIHSSLFEYRYLFSGTPADVPEKLYNQLTILDPYLTHRLSYTEWLGNYATLGTRFSAYAIRDWKKDKLERLNKKFTKTYGIYRNSSDVLDLPEHYEKRVYVDMHPKHRALYENFVIHVVDRITNEGATTRDIIKSFPLLSLSLDCPPLLEKHQDTFDKDMLKLLSSFNTGWLNKLEVVDEVIEEEGTKGIIWISHPKTAHMLAERYAKYKPLVIIGETPEQERNQLLKDFETKEEHKLLIANIIVLNTSVNLVFCNWQLYLERVWAFAPYMQSMKRIHRIGQKKAVKTYIPLYTNSLDLVQDKNLVSKDTLVRKLTAKTFLTQEEWANIFNGNVENDDSW